MRAAAAVLAVQAVAEVIWTIRLVSVVNDDSELFAATVGGGSVIGVAALGWLVWRGRARTLAAVVEVAIVGGSVDWLIVFPRLRIETGAIMVLGALAIVLLADRRRPGRSRRRSEVTSARTAAPRRPRSS